MWSELDVNKHKENNYMWKEEEKKSAHHGFKVITSGEQLNKADLYISYFCK